MPVEIRELNIKISVENPSSANSNTTTPATRPATGRDRQDDLLAASLEQTVELLKQQKER